MESRRTASARRWTAGASVVLVAGAVLVAVIASGPASARSLAAPANTSQPTIAGTAAVGQTLTGTQGTWSNSPTSFTYQWVRCPPNGGLPDGSNCSYIPGASTTAYIVSSADVGHRLRFRVTATNADGQQTAASNATALISSAPVNTSEPVISGSPVQGQTLTVTNGGWTSGGPITFYRQWVRCAANGGAADGSNCPPISGAIGQSYTLAAGDVGHRLRVRVVAMNGGGSTLAASDPSAVVQPSSVGRPRNTKEPSISGNAQQGQTLTADLGSWTGASPIQLFYQWARCGADGGKPDGSNCPAATGTFTGSGGLKYTLTAADVGKRMRVRVVARNAAGDTGAASDATATVQSGGPALPAGAIKLPNGKYSIPVTSVSLPARLVIDGIKFTPKVVRSRATTIVLQVHISDTRGFYVRDALVFSRSTPLVTSSTGEQRSGQDGWTTLRLRPQRDFPLKNGYSVQFFVRARKQGDNLLAGVSTRRLVQVRTARG
jgi:hypothetical protein